MKTPFHSLTLLLAASLIGCTQQEAPPRPTPKVTVACPEATTVSNWDEYPGHLEAVEKVEVRPRVSGHIESIHFKDGAEVKAGDLLFVIDPHPYEAELEHARAELRRAEIHAELARNDLKRADSLRNTRAISEEEYDSRSKTAREAEAAVAAARAAEAAARINLDYTSIKAPIAGRISQRLVTVGNFVQIQASGGAATILTTIVSMDPIYCTFDADEAAFLRYRSHGTGNGLGRKDSSLACELALGNEQGFPHKGHIDFFDNQVNPMTGTIRMRGIFANPDRLLIAGMFATIRVPAGPPAQALLVPAVAIGSDQGNKFVLVVNAQSVAEAKPVTVGRQHGAMTAVLSGLTTKDRVIVNGLMLTRPGSPVQVVDTPPAPATH
jgi:RND family efflux transporter MFP subunit